MTISSISKREKRVAVIGAGPAGLATTRYFVDAGYETQTFEATNKLGGTWAYSPTPCRSSAVYASLHCNIPNCVMSFSDFPFPPNTPTYPSHRHVLTYLQAYAKEHNLYDHITFNAPVIDLRKTQHPDNGQPMWSLTISSGEHQRRFYHAVAICVGHFSEPCYWEIPGYEHLAANGIPVQHSGEYREPSSYIGKNVLVVGGGPSGTDLALELTSVARTVTIAHNKGRLLFRKMPKNNNLREVTRTSRVLPTGDVELIDGTVVHDIDMVLACTGFFHSIPFLHVPGPPAVKVALHGKTVQGLSAMCIARCDPSLALIGLPGLVVPFGLVEDQAEFFRAVLEGRVSRKRLAKWDAYEEGYIRTKSDGSDHKFFLLAARQWEYRKRLSLDTGRKSVQPSIVEIYNRSAANRDADVTAYRQHEFEQLGPGPGEWRETFDGKDVTGM